MLNLIASLWNRIFRRKPAPAPVQHVIDRRRLTEDWQRGDLAICIDDKFYPGTPVDPKREELLRVSEVLEGIGYGTRIVAYFLAFEGRGNFAWDAHNFRKVRPETERAETWFAALVKRGMGVGA